MRGSSGGAGSMRAHPVLLPFSDDAQDPDIYRRVFISLRLPDTSRCRSIGLTSAVRGEGRTTLARGFALTLAADLEVPVWLAELDLEHPSLADYFGLPPAPGLCDVLRGGLELGDVAFPVAENLSVLPAGAVQREAPRLLRQLGNEDPFARPGMPQRMVVFDLPPVVACSYGPLVAGLADALVLVIRAGTTPASLVHTALQRLEGSPPQGTILNAFRSALPRWYPGQAEVS